MKEPAEILFEVTLSRASSGRATLIVLQDEFVIRKVSSTRTIHVRSDMAWGVPKMDGMDSGLWIAGLDEAFACYRM